MSEKIISKVFQYGDEKESSWPSQYGTGEKGVFHIDHRTGKVAEGYPAPRHEKFGTPPQVIFDSMPAEYHEKAGRMVESRQEWKMLDEQTGSLTFGSVEEVKRHTSSGVNAERQALKKSRRKASVEATKAYQANPKEVKDKLRKRGEEQIKTLKEAGMTKTLKEMGVNYE